MAAPRSRIYGFGAPCFSAGIVRFPLQSVSRDLLTKCFVPRVALRDFAGRYKSAVEPIHRLFLPYRWIALILESIAFSILTAISFKITKQEQWAIPGQTTHSNLRFQIPISFSKLAAVPARLLRLLLSVTRSLSDTVIYECAVEGKV